MTCVVPNPLPISHHAKRTKPDEIRLIVLVLIVFIGEMLLGRSKHRPRLLVRRIHTSEQAASQNTVSRKRKKCLENFVDIFFSLLLVWYDFPPSFSLFVCLSFASSSSLMMMSSMMCWMTHKIINQRFVSTQWLFFEWKRPRKMRSLIGALFPSDCVLSIEERRTNSRCYLLCNDESTSFSVNADEQVRLAKINFSIVIIQIENNDDGEKRNSVLSLLPSGVIGCLFLLDFSDLSTSPGLFPLSHANKTS